MRTLLPLSLVFSLSLGCADKGVDDSGGGDDAGTDSGDAPNTAPVAVDDSAATWSGLGIEIDVLDNDDDADNDSLTITEVTQPDNGFVEIDSSGTDSVFYTPEGSFVGVDSFSYTINDGNGGTDAAAVAVNVTDAPTLVITGPVEGAELDGPEITIEFEVNGCTVGSPGGDAGGCHLHKYLDGAQYTDEGGSGFGHYDAGSFIISPVADGEHSFMLYLIANDGSDAPFEPLIEDTVNFTVGTIPSGG